MIPEWTHMQGWGGVEQVLHSQLAAAQQVAVTKLLDELQVVNAVSHRHGVLQTHIWKKHIQNKRSSINMQCMIRFGKNGLKVLQISVVK